MVKSVACIPCAKRKVRCDRQEPCCHCKRRKKEDCTYPDVSSPARIKQLEALVRSLGQSPDKEEGVVNVQAETSPASIRFPTRPSPAGHDLSDHQSPQHLETSPNNDPVIIEEGGERVYLEASTWHSWDKRPKLSDDPASHNQSPMRACIPAQSGFGALQNIIHSDDSIDLARGHPTPDIASILWKAYNRNVDPLVRIVFQWEISQMSSMVLVDGATKDLSAQEHALFFGVYLNSVASLSENQCLDTFGQPRKTFLSQFRALFEHALARADFLGRSEVILIQASVLYISASLDEVSTRSLWSFMGIVIRHAERLGLHRDGTLLSLPPAETEKRRRIWWQLQHMDIALAIRSGSISLVLMADWDVKLPLNIEDEDISAVATDFPPERKGLTSMSYCLWTYYVLEKQRSFRRADGSRIGGSWVADRSLSREQRENFIQELEQGINTRFIQYCDPIKPLDLFILIVTRTFTWGMRRLVIHSDEFSRDASDAQDSHGKDLLYACARCLEYDVYMHSQPTLERFYWRAMTFFPWHAFVYVISESSRCRDGCEDTWDLLDRLYTANSHLSRFTDDRRKPRAAELIRTAWQAYEISFGERHQTKPRRPAFLAKLDTLLNGGKPHAQNTEIPLSSNTNLAANDGGNFLPISSDEDKVDYSAMNTLPDLNLADIDWSFWSNLE